MTMTDLDDPGFPSETLAGIYAWLGSVFALAAAFPAHAHDTGGAVLVSIIAMFMLVVGHSFALEARIRDREEEQQWSHE